MVTILRRSDINKKSIPARYMLIAAALLSASVLGGCADPSADPSATGQTEITKSSEDENVIVIVDDSDPTGNNNNTAENFVDIIKDTGSNAPVVGGVVSGGSITDGINSGDAVGSLIGDASGEDDPDGSGNGSDGSDNDSGQAQGENGGDDTGSGDTGLPGGLGGTDSGDGGAQDSSPAEYSDKQPVSLDPSWKYADYSKINSGSAVFYKASGNRKGKVIGVNAGHGTKGGASVKTYCHPDKSPKVTGGTTSSGAVEAAAISGGMTFHDGTTEAKVTLNTARFLRDELLKRGYDVLMVRDGDDVQLDNIARTVICNNVADCHISLHWDGDQLDYDKGCFYIAVPDGIKNMEPVAGRWQQHDSLGEALIGALKADGFKIYNGGSMKIDLTQTSYSTIPSVDIELGNKASDHSDARLKAQAAALAKGVDAFF